MVVFMVTFLYKSIVKLFFLWACGLVGLWACGLYRYIYIFWLIEKHIVLFYYVVVNSCDFKPLYIEPKRVKKKKRQQFTYAKSLTSSVKTYGKESQGSDFFYDGHNSPQYRSIAVSQIMV